MTSQDRQSLAQICLASLCYNQSPSDHADGLFFFALEKLWICRQIFQTNPRKHDSYVVPDLLGWTKLVSHQADKWLSTTTAKPMPVGKSKLKRIWGGSFSSANNWPLTISGLKIDYGNAFHSPCKACQSICLFNHCGPHSQSPLTLSQKFNSLSMVHNIKDHFYI